MILELSDRGVKNTGLKYAGLNESGCKEVEPQLTIITQIVKQLNYGGL